jgi:HlyD family secretion protein
MRLVPYIILAVIAAVAAAFFIRWQADQAAAIPAGLARANGRIEAERVAIATKYAGRVAEILVKEGDFVERGAVIARMDTAELLAEIAAAKARARQALQGIGQAKAQLLMRQAELKLANVELQRAQTLRERDYTSASTVDQRQAQRDVAAAAVTAAQAAIGDAEAAQDAAEASVAQLQAVLNDMTLVAPTAGRVEYKLVQAGEVLSAGAPVVSLLDLTDVYMTIFLPTSDAGRVGIGSEGRIVLDAAPAYVVPANVSFVAAEAQFTPKFVETENEREKLMYRIKLKIDPKLLETYRDYVKAGLTGDAYVRVQADAAWPGALTPKLPPAPGNANQSHWGRRRGATDRRPFASLRQDRRARCGRARGPAGGVGSPGRTRRRRQVDPARRDRRRQADPGRTGGSARRRHARPPPSSPGRSAHRLHAAGSRPQSLPDAVGGREHRLLLSSLRP